MFVRLAARVSAAAIAAGFMSGAYAASITPATFEATIGVGGSVSIDKVITLDPGGASKVDIFFLADNTGSMGGIITTFKGIAAPTVGGLATTYGDAAFGVGRYLGDPFEGSSGAFPRSNGTLPTNAYQLQSAISTTQASATTAIGAWFASGGGDTPEANFFALHQIATEGANTPGTAAMVPKGTGSVTGWRAGAERVIVWFGDATSHNETVTEAQTIASLNAAGVTVVALNSGNDNSGIDGSYTGANGVGTDSTQAGDIAAATGGSLTNNATSLSAAALQATIEAAIGVVTSELDLTFLTIGLGPGLTVTFECTDALGCDDVPGGASRSFRVTFTGLTAGLYEFQIGARGVGATEFDRICVGDTAGCTTRVPEPGTLALVALAVLGLAARRRRERKV